jgi:hypothetical protein
MNRAKKTVILFILLGCIGISLGSENGPSIQPIQMPLAQFDRLQSDTDSIGLSSIGFYSQTENSRFIALYAHTSINAALPDNLPTQYHSIDVLAETKNDRHQYLGIFKSDASKPVSGGLHTFNAAAVYGYQFIQQSDLSLVIGSGLALGDFGIKTHRGDIWPIIPVPLLRASYQGNWLTAELEFLTSPNLDLRITPSQRLSLNNSLRFDELNSWRDLVFDSNLAYQLLPNKHSLSDLAHLSIGIKNDHIGSFSIGDGQQEEKLQAQYYALYSGVDLTLLKLTIGHNFNSQWRYQKHDSQARKNGYFVSFQAMLPL